MSSTSKIVVKPSTLGVSTITASVKVETPETRWVGLEVLHWKDQDAKERKWEMASRKTTGKAGVDAVAILALLHRPTGPLSIPIILQYRPPVGKICVELPAGLVDESETCETAAIRELHEETGYGGPEFEGRIKIVDGGSVIFSDPGMTSANMKNVVLEVTLREGEEEPKPKLEAGEHIEVRITPVAELYEYLQAYEALGYIVDARLSALALGIHTARRLRL